MDKEIAIDGKPELERLVEATAEGEAITLTRRGSAVASLTRATPRPSMENQEGEGQLERLRAFRKGQRLGSGLTIKDLLDESRGR